MNQNSNNKEDSTDDKNNTNEPSDEELVLFIKKGSQKHYQMLVKRYINKVWRLGMSILKNEEDAEDATQEVFLSLLQSLDKWDSDGKAKLSTWIYRIAFNKAIDIKRSKRPTVSEEDVPETASDKNAYNDLLEHQVSDKVKELLEKIPENQKLAITMYYFEGLNVKEISSRLDSTEQGVRSLLKRGRKALKDKIQYEPAFKSWDFSDHSGHLWG